MYKNFSQDFWLVKDWRNTLAPAKRESVISVLFLFIFLFYKFFQRFCGVVIGGDRLRIAENPNVRDLVIIGLRLGLIAS
jgi:hypothetical protein